MKNLEYKICLISSSCWLGHTYTQKSVQLLLLTHTCNYKLKIKRCVQKVFTLVCQNYLIKYFKSQSNRQSCLCLSSL